MSEDMCSDDRFELIGKAKAKLLEATNIEMRPDEMAVIDSILFRCWQMGWLDKLRDDDSRYSELFGTPERAARTLSAIGGRYPCDKGAQDCETCPLNGAPCRLNRGNPEESKLLEWLRGESDG